MKKILIIIPAYNEEATIQKTIEQTLASSPHCDILVVNDGSWDNTSKIVRTITKAKVLDLPFNLGIGGAEQAGYLFAYLQNYDYVVRIDADGQHNPSDIKILLDRIQNQSIDLVIGSRYIRNSGFQSSFPRRFGIKILSTVLSILIRKKIHDPTSGFRAANKRVIKLFSKIYPTDYPEPQSLLWAHQAHFVIAEESVVMKERQGGQSSIKPIHTFYYMAKVLIALIVDSLKNSKWYKEHV